MSARLLVSSISAALARAVFERGLVSLTTAGNRAQLARARKTFATTHILRFWSLVAFNFFS